MATLSSARNLTRSSCEGPFAFNFAISSFAAAISFSAFAGRQLKLMEKWA
jgi:hypothetical protein